MDYILALSEEYYEEVAVKNIKTISDKIIVTLELCNEYKTYTRPDTFFIGKDGDIKISDSNVFLKVSGNRIKIIGEVEGELIYLNKRRLRKDCFDLIRGDCILIGECLLTFHRDYIKVCGRENKFTSLLTPMNKSILPFSDFPEYKRSPRIIKRIPNDNIEIKSPPEFLKVDKNELIMTVLPPITSSAVTVGVGMLIGRGSYLLMSIGITIVTVIFSIIRFFKDRSERSETNRKNAVLYEKYLLDKRKELYNKYIEEKESYNYNYPSTSDIVKIINNYSSRIYERLPSDRDFLNITLGRYIGEVSFRVTLTEKGISSNIDKLYEEAKSLKDEYSTIEKDLVFSLRKSRLGLVGNRQFVHEQLKSYICQLTTFQSYRDLQIIVVFDEKYQSSFEWMKWLPHCRLQMSNVFGMVYSDRTRDQVLNSVNQVLKERSQKYDESKGKSTFLPHFLFVIDEPEFILSHSIIEYINGDCEKLGCSVIYTSYLRANLPEFIDTIVLLDHAKEGTLLIKYGEYIDKKININQNGSTNFELLARNIGVLSHVLSSTSHIPENMTFFELYNINKINELNIEKRWSTNKSEKSLAVPIGMRAENDIVELDLHEKVHGPHGLVAGTTGSGKSEIIQTYITSLAINFSPYEVGFLLIDYKGGGMASLFRKLPHLLGTITNLDGSESMRALASIKSELASRQRIFNENNVNHINAYMSLFREGVVNVPMPHLFLISDEFAELKKEQPEFMKELVSTARIGRSLGVHLILATQKPSGVVDDQIWSNSRFKLALKVQDESDSKEILKTPDAASITLPGRAYLQVGNNEIYELFQSAWSGAPYYEKEESEIVLDNRVYIVNSIGQGMIVNEDLGLSEIEKKATSTQLEVIVDYINNYYEKWKIKSDNNVIDVKKPWLPPLNTKVKSPLINTAVSQSDYIENGISIPIGMLDIPELQVQKNYDINITNDGNTMYIASVGFGKSVFLTTVALSIALKYDVYDVNLFILDFGNNALISLKRLPHTAEYISLDDRERYNRLKRLLEDEIKNRKKLMAKEFSQNISMYNQTADETLTSWIVMIDNFDAIKEMGFEEEEFFTKISRDGMSLGIYIVITATRVNAIRSATYNNFKIKIAGYNFEKSEVLYMVGRSEYTIPEVKGRCLVKYNDRVSCMQIFTMTDFDNDLQYRNNIKAIVDNIIKSAGDVEARHMPVMPEELTLSLAESFVNNNIDIYVGIGVDNVEKEGFTLEESPIIILGNEGSGKTNLLKLLIYQMTDNTYISIFDSDSKELYQYKSEKIEIIKDIDEFILFMDRLEEEVIIREKQIEGLEEEQKKNVIRKLDRRAVFIDDLSLFFSHKTNAKSDIANVMERASKTGVFIAATSLLSKFYSGEPVTDLFKRSGRGVLLSNQSYMGVVPVELIPGVNEGVIYKKGFAAIVRIPKA